MGRGRKGRREEGRNEGIGEKQGRREGGEEWKKGNGEGRERGGRKGWERRGSWGEIENPCSARSAGSLTVKQRSGDLIDLKTLSVSQMQVTVTVRNAPEEDQIQGAESHPLPYAFQGNSFRV